MFVSVLNKALLFTFALYVNSQDVVEVPLMDNQNVPLVAMINTTKLNSAVKSYIQTTVDDYTGKRIPEIKNTLLDEISQEKANNRTAFTASLKTSVSSNKNIVFDYVWINNGGGYDPETGFFTAPQSGLYFISATLMSGGEKTALDARLWKNNIPLSRIFGSTSYATGTLNNVINLQKGEKVYLISKAGVYGDHYSYWSGYNIG